MQLARVYNDHLTVIAACKPAAGDDFGIANRDETEQQGAPDTADRSSQRRDRKNATFPLSPSKHKVLKISTQARPALMPSAAPPSAPGAKPGNASNAIFIQSS
jgi:hypothetical protein